MLCVPKRLIRAGLRSLVPVGYGRLPRARGKCDERQAMFSAMLLTISIVALAQFAMYYVRSVVAGVAAQTISEDVLAAVSLDGAPLCGRDFQVVAKLHELTPNLQRKSSGMALVRAYFSVVHAIGKVTAGRV